MKNAILIGAMLVISGCLSLSAVNVRDKICNMSDEERSAASKEFKEQKIFVSIDCT